MRRVIPLLAAASVALSAHADDGLDKKFSQLLTQDFRTKGIASLDRIRQDAPQRSCTEHNDHPPHDGPQGLDALEREQMATIQWPADGKFLGDWKAGEKVAQDGRGLTWSDKPGAPVGGGCYNCHQLAPQELSFGTIGPSLYHYGKRRPNTAENQKYTFGKIFNAKAYNLCTNMPRFGHAGALTQAQIKDLVALLMDPDSPVNK